MTNEQTPPPGWYPAPHANGEQRYWDGTGWAEPPAAPTAGTAAPTTNMKKRGLRWWAWVLIGIGALLLLIIVIGSMNRPASSTAEPSSTPSAEVSEEPTEEPTEEATEEPEAPAAPAPDVPRQEFSGTGDMVFDVNVTAPAIVAFTCGDCSSNTVVRTNGSESLLVNEIGPYNGARLINVSDGSITTQIIVEAKGNWILSIDDLMTAPTFTGAATGFGDSVVIMTGDFNAAAIVNDGGSNFVVRAYGEGNRTPLIVNVIGAYSGTVSMSAPAVVEVTSTGNWSITPQ